MALKIGNRVRQTSNTTGTSTFVLVSPDTGDLSFVSQIGDTNLVPYVADNDSGDWEIGIGTVVSGSPDQLQRTTVLASSNSNNLVNFPSGGLTITCEMPKSLFLFPGSCDANAITSIASGSTCDLGTSRTQFVTITGTTTITSFGSSPNCKRFVKFSGALTLTHNATSLILQDGANITTAAGDTCIASSDASGNWTVSAYVAALAPVDGTPESTVASASTCDIGAVNTKHVAISGTTTITSLGTKANQRKHIRFTGALTLTHNATSLILPGGANITTAAGDTCLGISDASGNWRIYFYQPANGMPFSFTGEGSVASASTTNLATSSSIRQNITGTTTITSFGSGANLYRIVRFSGALTLTHNATSLILRGGANRTTAANDTGCYQSDASGNWRELWYSRADGSVISATTGALKVDSSGNVQATAATGANAAYFYKSSASLGELILSIQKDAGSASALLSYAVDVGNYNAAAAGMKVGQNSGTSRSINAGGTINASGADYAEYETKSDGCGTVAKGQIVGFDEEGKITDKFAEAISFGVKSTNPSYIGGDTWGSEDAIGMAEPKEPLPPDEAPGAPSEPEIEEPVRGDDEDEDLFNARVASYDFEIAHYQVALAAYEEAMEIFNAADTQYKSDKAAYDEARAEFDERLEAARQKVDRIAYSGKVPCNVSGASIGDYIVAAADGAGIKGVAISNPTFEQYQMAVGRVRAMLPDGRPVIAVLIH